MTFSLGKSLGERWGKTGRLAMYCCHRRVSEGGRQRERESPCSSVGFLGGLLLFGSW